MKCQAPDLQMVSKPPKIKRLPPTSPWRVSRYRDGGTGALRWDRLPETCSSTPE